MKNIKITVANTNIARKINEAYEGKFIRNSRRTND